MSVIKISLIKRKIAKEKTYYYMPVAFEILLYICVLLCTSKR